MKKIAVIPYKKIALSKAKFMGLLCVSYALAITIAQVAANVIYLIFSIFDIQTPNPLAVSLSEFFFSSKHTIN